MSGVIKDVCNRPRALKVTIDRAIPCCSTVPSSTTSPWPVLRQNGELLLGKSTNESNRFSVDNLRVRVCSASNSTMSVKNTDDRLSSYKNPNTRNATYFLSEDVEGFFPADFRKLKKAEHYAHLKKLNEGFCLGLNRYNDQYTTREMAGDTIEALGSQLDLTNREQLRTRRYFMSIRHDNWGIDYYLLIYSICCYVVENNDKNNQRRSHPNVPDEDRDNRFQHIEDSLGLDYRDVVKTYGKVQSDFNSPIPPAREEFERDGHHPGGGI